MQFSKLHVFLLICAGAFALGLVLGTFTTLNFFSSNPQVEIKKDTQEMTSSTESSEEGNTSEQIEFEGETYVILKKISIDADGQFMDIMHLCKPEALFGTYTGKELFDSIQCGWGGAERLVMRQGTRISTLDIADADRSGYRSILMGARLFPDGEKLMVVFEEDPCLGYLGLCINSMDNALLFTLSDGAFADMIELTGYVFDINGLIFNETATRYINFVGCPEGCPDKVVEGYDLQTKKSYDFLNVISRYEDDGLWFPDEEKSYWVDDDTFSLVTRNDEKMKTVNLQFK